MSFRLFEGVFIRAFFARELRIRRTLDRARHAGRSPWDGLGRLGDGVGGGGLEELAASVRLAGTEGARIRSSLTAKSASLRRRQMADAQGRANATTERLFLPVIVLMIGLWSSSTPLR